MKNEECGAKSQAAVNLWIISDQTIIIKPILCNGSWLDNGNYSAWCCEAARVLPEAIACSDNNGILFCFWHYVLFLFFAHHVFVTFYILKSLCSIHKKVKKTFHILHWYWGNGVKLSIILLVHPKLFWLSQQTGRNVHFWHLSVWDFSLELECLEWRIYTRY